MKFKRFMALAMAGVMTMGMAATSFADGPYEEVNISKTVVANEGVTFPADGKSFVFNFVAITDDAPDIDPVTVNFANANAFEAAVTEAISVDDEFALGEYSYTITEEPLGRNEDGSAIANAEWTSDDTQYELVIFVTNSGESGDDGSISKKYEYAIYSLKEDGSRDTKKNVADFENIYKPVSGDATSGSLTITKDVTEEQWSDVNSYPFTVTFTDGTYTSVEEFGVTYAIGDEAPQDLVGKTASFELKKGETVTFFGLPQGTTYEIVENNDNDKFGQYFNGATIEGAEEADKDTLTASGVLGEDTTEVKYTNDFTQEDITVTGLAISVAPFIAMFAAVGAAIALYVAAKRRVR